MAYEQKPNSGSLWHQAEKKSDKAPDFTGSVFFDRDYLAEMAQSDNHLVEIKLSGWRNKVNTKNGERNVLNVSVDTFKKTEAPKSNAKDPWDDF